MGARKQHDLGFRCPPRRTAKDLGGQCSGQVYRALDAGASWKCLKREFGDIRALAWTPSAL